MPSIVSCFMLGLGDLTMSPKLNARVVEYAIKMRHVKKWKKRLYALLYGCNSLEMLNKIR